jgi:ketosteroid isomerase-like protein
MTRLNSLSAISITLLIFGCAERRQPSLTLSPADSAEIAQLEKEFVRTIQSRDWASLAALYDSAAVLLPPNAPEVIGANTVSQWFASTGLEIKNFETRVRQLDGRADLAMVWGTYTLTFTLPKSTTVLVDSGKFLWGMHRGADAHWRITVDMFNTSLPPPPAVK